MSGMQSRYKRVAQEEEKKDEEESLKKLKSEKVERLTAKAHALFWVLLAIGAAVYTDIFNRALTDERVDRLYLNLAVLCFITSMVIMLYLTLYLPLVAKVTIPWDIYCPNLVPTSTVLSLLCVIFLNISLWPLFGLLTPPLLFILFMGFVFVAHFVPWPC